MSLDEFYFLDPRLILVPIEQLSETGIRRDFLPTLVERSGLGSAYFDLLSHSFALYWQRSSSLASRSHTWPAPRLRHIGLIRGAEAEAVRPFAQILNTSAWLLYESDFSPQVSNVEFGAYLFAHGDRLAVLGDVSLAPIHSAPWWFDRSAAERAAFHEATYRSTRPDADSFRTLADAIPWLCELAHETLKPAPANFRGRAIPGSGLSVSARLEGEPPALATRVAEISRASLTKFHRRWQGSALPALRRLVDWIVEAAPPVLVTSEQNRVLWDPDHRDRIGALQSSLKTSGPRAIEEIEGDLRAVAAKTRSFLASLASPLERQPLDPKQLDLAQAGYAYLHRDRLLCAYNLDEPGIERRLGPPLPYARAMLAARTAHEWAHLAVDRGLVPLMVAEDQHGERIAALAETLEATVRAAPARIRAETAADLNALLLSGSPQRVDRKHSFELGGALVQLFLGRMPDFQANLLATRFETLEERETYVRHNIRTLRSELRPNQRWRMLARYLLELQYLRFSAVPDRLSFFARSTWFQEDFLDSGILDWTRYGRLAELAGQVCLTYEVDASRFRELPYLCSVARELGV